MSVEVEDPSVSSVESATARNNLIELDSSRSPEDNFRILATYQLAYSIVGLLAGLLCMLLGVGLYIRQVTESIGWIASESKAWSFLFEALPGFALFAAGLVIVFLTRMGLSVKVRHPSNHSDGKNSGSASP